MSRSKRKSLREDCVNGAFIVGIIAVIVAFLALIGLNVKIFDPIDKAIGSLCMSDGFFYSRHREHSGVCDPDVVIVDLAGVEGRGEIAGIVNDINSCSPRVLAVDVIFGKTASSDSFQDSLLVDAFRETSRLVLAQRIVRTADGHRLERSFFADDVDCVEGDVNLEYGIVRHIPAEVESDGVAYPSFVSRIASLAGRSEVVDNELINWSSLDTISVPPSRISAAGPFLRDKIVLLGDSRDLRDYHDIPVLSDGEARISGLNIIAQSLYTLRPGNGFRTTPTWFDILLGIVLTYAFCTFCISPVRRSSLDDGWITAAQAAVLVLLLSISYILFWVFHLNMSLAYWFLGVGCANLAAKIYFFFKR